MPIPTTDTATVLATPDTTVLATPDTDTVLDTSDTADTTATARGPLRLRLSPPLPLRPRRIPTTDTTAMDTTVLDTDVPTDTVLDTTDTPVSATTEDTTVKCPADSSQPKTILGITSRSSEKLDRSVWFDPHQCYQFQCHQASPS